MAGVADKVILPLDTGNTGKKIRTITRTVGADSVHEHFFIMSSARDYTGVYGFHSGILTLLAAAQNGTTTGFAWLINPIGSTVTIAIERLRYVHQISSNLAVITVPRIVAQLFTFTGTASGASITPGKFNAAYAAPQGSVRSAMTGLTITLGGIIDATLPCVCAGTAGWTPMPPSFDDNIAISELSDIQLATGAGLVIYQADAGTTADTRKLLADITTAEFN